MTCCDLAVLGILHTLAKNLCDEADKIIKGVYHT